MSVFDQDLNRYIMLIIVGGNNNKKPGLSEKVANDRGSPRNTKVYITDKIPADSKTVDTTLGGFFIKAIIHKPSTPVKPPIGHRTKLIFLNSLISKP